MKNIKMIKIALDILWEMITLLHQSLFNWNNSRFSLPVGVSLSNKFVTNKIYTQISTQISLT